MAPHSTSEHLCSTNDLVWNEKDLDAKHLSHESVSSLFHTWTTEADDSTVLNSIGRVDDDYEDDPIMMTTEAMVINTPTYTCNVRQVLEELDSQHAAVAILELPPLTHRATKRPLCTFQEYRGTRRADVSVSPVVLSPKKEVEDDVVDCSALSMLSEEYDTLEADFHSLPSLHDDIDVDENEALLFTFSEDRYQALKAGVSLEVPPIEKSLKNDKQLNEYLAQFHRLVAKARQIEKELQGDSKSCESKKRTKKPKLVH
jgi:hypothetical protein